MLFAAVMAAPASGQQSSGSKQQPTAGTANQPATVKFEDVEDHPEKYLGKMVTVEGEVTDVLGPHLFVMDEPRWFHLRRGMLVVVPEPFAAIVRRDAPVRVTGTVEKVAIAEARKRWRFLNDPKIEVDIFERPVIVAREVTTVAPTIVTLKIGPDQPVGTTGSHAAITDLNQVAAATDSSLVGRKVDVSGTVLRTADDGFWVRTASGDEVFVMPATSPVREGQTVRVRGTVLESPHRLHGKTAKGKSMPVYIYADSVAPK
jgi:uncharacterized protein YdeI (BOF family)